MSNIQVKIICDSVSSVNGVRLTTFELVYPRLCHSELITHRMLSRNAASSRAIPFDKMVEQLDGKPVRFGQANPGMQDKGVDYDATVMYQYHSNTDDWTDLGPAESWEIGKQEAIDLARRYYEAGYHKQVYNRLTEPFQMIKVIVTATEWLNFFWLRNDVAADPTLQALAQKMEEAYNSNVPVELKPGEWHLPYVDCYFIDREDGTRSQQFYILVDFDDEEIQFMLTKDEAIKVSAARCAAVSFRNTDYNLEKSLQVYERLVGDERKHSSALEHQATPIQASTGGFANGVMWVNIPSHSGTWEQGITHLSKDNYLWSGNFRAWVQYRQLIPGQNKSAY